jgi:hypothetical protein
MPLGSGFEAGQLLSDHALQKMKNHQKPLPGEEDPTKPGMELDFLTHYSTHYILTEIRLDVKRIPFFWGEIYIILCGI